MVVTNLGFHQQKTFLIYFGLNFSSQSVCCFKWDVFLACFPRQRVRFGLSTKQCEEIRAAFPKDSCFWFLLEVTQNRKEFKAFVQHSLWVLVLSAQGLAFCLCSVVAEASSHSWLVFEQVLNWFFTTAANCCQHSLALMQMGWLIS